MTIQKKLSKIHVFTCFRRYFVNSFDAFLNLHSSFWRRVVQDGSPHRIFSPDWSKLYTYDIYKSSSYQGCISASKIQKSKSPVKMPKHSYPLACPPSQEKSPPGFLTCLGSDSYSCHNIPIPTNHPSLCLYSTINLVYWTDSTEKNIQTWDSFPTCQNIAYPSHKHHPFLEIHRLISLCFCDGFPPAAACFADCGICGSRILGIRPFAMPLGRGAMELVNLMAGGFWFFHWAMNKETPGCV